ncbi:hypothetical protein M0802_013094 [Mischocyttarus mexicanus]|nr:hypothetical protein M0802_013094 [Mischocyttarus mexicanus]
MTEERRHPQVPARSSPPVGGASRRPVSRTTSPRNLAVVDRRPEARGSRRASFERRFTVEREEVISVIESVSFGEELSSTTARGLSSQNWTHPIGHLGTTSYFCFPDGSDQWSEEDASGNAASAAIVSH